jgi:hypothetical protein
VDHMRPDFEGDLDIGRCGFEPGNARMASISL